MHFPVPPKLKLFEDKNKSVPCTPWFSHGSIDFRYSGPMHSYTIKILIFPQTAVGPI